MGNVLVFDDLGLNGKRDVITFTVELHVFHAGLWFWVLLLAVFVDDISWGPLCSLTSDV